MQYGICNLGIVPMRYETDDKSELVSQMLYGEYFKVLEKRKKELPYIVFSDKKGDSYKYFGK